MKTFQIKILYLIGIVLLFNAFLFLFSYTYYHSPYIKVPDKTFSSFIFADSHGLPLEKYPEKYGVYNFSGGGDSYFDIKRKISYLLENNYTIDTIYLSTDEHMLSTYREEFNNLERGRFYISKIDCEDNYSYIKEKYVNYYFPLFSSTIHVLFRNYIKTSPKASKSNQLSSLKSWHQYTEVEKTRSINERYAMQFESHKKSEPLEEALVKIIEICQANEIQLMGLNFPLVNRYVDKIKDHDYGADQILLSRNCEVLDFKTIFSDKEMYFVDQDHISPHYGQLLAEMIFDKKTN